MNTMPIRLQLVWKHIGPRSGAECDTYIRRYCNLFADIQIKKFPTGNTHSPTNIRPTAAFKRCSHTQSVVIIKSKHRFIIIIWKPVKCGLRCGMVQFLLKNDWSLHVYRLMPPCQHVVMAWLGTASPSAGFFAAHPTGQYDSWISTRKKMLPVRLPRS